MPARKRLPYFIFAITLIVISLPARLTDWYPDFIVIYVADAVWALMVYLMLVVFFPRTKAVKLLIIALLGCWLVEFSQLYQADWINQVRHWPGMGLLLGYGFRIEDLIAYTLGIFAGFLIDSFLVARSAKSDAMLESS
jgi:glycopeptide antibiotics resistance protein